MKTTGWGLLVGSCAITRANNFDENGAIPPNPTYALFEQGVNLPYVRMSRPEEGHAVFACDLAHEWHSSRIRARADAICVNRARFRNVELHRPAR